MRILTSQNLHNQSDRVIDTIVIIIRVEYANIDIKALNFQTKDIISKITVEIFNNKHHSRL